ncbi:hypothetical protein ASPWEDRAFT_165836 [Aspergillus wentii DTO 134E9]|uniref:Condensation domain-containing protein n=1 Tax=Aspergillus wentii DTO 134E9 TaxID=1073089 RepID=A0A1L9R528_ASPWE|nr:uncharacterized protein ASPWEDRAFT_165836 [Aspergillus wentii DTO 134E9]KAI9927274.1 hypothetical protein MW887_003661 [Aspergillus wentii]OJJ30004.1 hypothetical protein ASPWEDRAFT_165836 [Aspergillus wentii DTO 134E9]
MHPSFEPFILSPLDHVISKIVLKSYLSFHCNDPSQAAAVLQAGIADLVSHLPFVAGCMSSTTLPNGKQNATLVSPPTAAFLEHVPMVVVKHHNQCLTPDNATPDCPLVDYEAMNGDTTFFRAVDPPAVNIMVRWQINVLKDGIILGSSFHHQFVDGKALVQLHETLGAFCRRASGEKNVIISTGVRIQEAARRQIEQNTTSSNVDLDGAYASRPMMPLPRELLANAVSEKLYFSSSKVKELKNRFNSLLSRDPTKAKLSSNDVVTALIWLCACRARLQALPAEQRQQAASNGSVIMTVADVRSMMSPPLPDTYIANAIAMTTCSHSLNLAQKGNLDAHQQDLSDLFQIALQVQKGLRKITPDYVRGLITQQLNSDNWGSFRFRYAELMVSNMRYMPFVGIDFGSVLGKSKVYDMPKNPFDGICWVLPAPCDARGLSMTEEPWRIRLTLQREAMKELLQDRLYQWISTEKPIQAKL